MRAGQWISGLPVGLVGVLMAVSAWAQSSSLPDLQPVALLIPPEVTALPGSNITVISCITNQGVVPVDPGVPVWNALYLSTNGSLDSTAQCLQSWYSPSRILPVGASWETNIIQVPQIPSGTYYLILKADLGGILNESDESNNVLVTSIAFNILLPDLVPLVLECPSALVASPNPKITLVWGATNQGDGAVSGVWSDEVYVSSKPVQDSSAVKVGYVCEPRSIVAGGSYIKTTQFTLPVTETGRYFLFFEAASGHQVYESSYTNNLVVVPITVEVQPSDLMPITTSVPRVLTCPPNPTLRFTWGVTNQGIGLAINDWPWSDRVFGSTNPVMDSSAICLAGSSGPLSLRAGDCYWRNEEVRVPVVDDGTYYLFFSTDAFDNVFEPDESNNVAVVAVNFHIVPPDLVPVALQVATALTNLPYPQVTLTWAVTNQGVGSAIAPFGWTDSIYVSSNLISDPVGLHVGGSDEFGPVEAGDSYWLTNTVARAPMVNSGTYYFILRTDTGNVLPELNESNNTLVVPVMFFAAPAPDLVPVLQLPATMKMATNPVIALVWGVTNQGLGPAIGYQPASIRFVTDPVTGASASLAFSSGPKNIPPGGCVWWTNTVQLPVTQRGTYSFVVECDLCNFVYESNEANNIAIFPVSFGTDEVPLAPSLGIVSSSTNAAVITWPSTVGWALEQSPVANASSAGWSPVLPSQETNNGHIWLSIPQDFTNRFFRLRKL